MITWKDSGRRGEIYSEKGDFICIVQTVRIDRIKIEPWPEGEENFRLILKAPQMLEALEAIRDMAWQLKKITYKVTREDWETVEGYARTAIAAVKGENDEKA